MGWISLLSLLTFIVSLIVVPIICARIPSDYFESDRRHQSSLKRFHPLVFIVALSVKNLLALALIVGGIMMLILPGQGILTILIGIGISDFPGKYHLERKLVTLPGVLSAINWMRSKSGVEPLRLPEHFT